MICIELHFDYLNFNSFISDRLEVGTTKDRLQKGLDKMISTAEMVGKLQIDIKG